MIRRGIGFLPALCLLVFAGCAAKQLAPGAERVLVTRMAAAKECKYLGSVVGEQGGSLTGGMTSNKNLAEGAMNDMKNKAHSMGANYVVIEDTSHGNTMSGNGHSMSGQQTDVTHMGNAFKCPESDGAPAPAGSAQR